MSVIAIIDRQGEPPVTWAEVLGKLTTQQIIPQIGDIIEDSEFISIQYVGDVKEGKAWRTVDSQGKTPYNDARENEGGFMGSQLSKTLNEEFITKLAPELAAVLKDHVVNESIDGTVYTSTNKIFLPSEYEFMGKAEWADYNGTDQQFEFFKAPGNLAGCMQWTGSLSAACADNFVCINPDGETGDWQAFRTADYYPVMVINGV